MNARAGGGVDPALAVIAKAPVPGRSKTRLSPPLSPMEAAELAEAALADTLEAVAATAATRKVLVLEGRPGPWLPDGIEVISQRGAGLDERLANAFTDLAAPALIIGMDTPQVGPQRLEDALGHLSSADAVLGPAADGGYWAFGLRSSEPRALLGVPMSTTRTFTSQRGRLRALGLDCAELGTLLDVDTFDDALAVAQDAPSTRFAEAVAAARRRGHRGARTMTPPPPLELYARALEERSMFVRREDGGRRCVPIETWLAPPTAADRHVLDCAVGPVLDVGCGPGRHALALARRGVEAVGVDIAPAAIRRARDRGARVLLASVFDPLPGAGQWQTALLFDGNIGIGGRPVPLLARIRSLLAPGGRILCELGSPGSATRCELIALEDADGVRSTWFAWARVSVDGLPPIVERAGLQIDAVWERDSRWFAQLCCASDARGVPLSRPCRTAPRPPVPALPATTAAVAASAPTSLPPRPRTPAARTAARFARSLPS
jgi:rSAM/selenodomain-associated transferase 1